LSDRATFSWATLLGLLLAWSASSCSRRLAGGSDDTSQPAPNALSPAASGLPQVCRRIAAMAARRMVGGGSGGEGGLGGLLG
jgi:hypothetical protein